MPNPPEVLIIGGPNGAGKSTLATQLVPRFGPQAEFVNADVIAAEISPNDVDSAAITAGRMMLTRLRTLAEQRSSFAFETTMATRSFAPFLRDLKNQGYKVHAAFVFVRSPDLSIARVASRVAHGGHHVPDETVRRRYERGIANFLELYLPLADFAQVFDNSARGKPSVVAEIARPADLAVYDHSAWTQMQEIAHGRH